MQNQFHNVFAKLKPVHGGFALPQRNGIFLTAAKETWCIGRGLSADAPMDVWVNPSKLATSRAVHAAIIWEPGSCKAYIVDRDSTNGTYVNGRRLQSGKRKLLKDGDKIWLGDVEEVASCGFTFQELWGQHNPFLSKYGCESKLGSGSFGDVYKFFLRAQPQKVYAVKVLDYSESSGRNQYESAVAEMTLQSDEARKHPNICPLIEAFQDDEHDTIYMVMPFMPLGDLTQHFNTNIGAGVPQVRSILKQVCSALLHLHSHKVIHRDIKPANIFVKSLFPLLVVIGDFGVARRVSMDDEEAMSFVGSAAYMAPEIATGDGYTSKVDSYSVGATGLHLVIGLKRSLFETDVAFSFNNPEPWISSRSINWRFADDKGLPDEGRELLEGLLHQDPQSRWSMERVAAYPWISNARAVAQAELYLEPTIHRAHADDLSVYSPASRIRRPASPTPRPSTAPPTPAKSISDLASSNSDEPSGSSAASGSSGLGHRRGGRRSSRQRDSKYILKAQARAEEQALAQAVLYGKKKNAKGKRENGKKKQQV